MRRKETHTEQQTDVCVLEDSLKEKTDHMAILPGDVQDLIRLYKTLNPEEDVQDLADKSFSGKWEPPADIADLAEYIKLSLLGEHVRNPLGLRASIIKQYKDGVLDLQEGLKALKVVDDGWAMYPDLTNREERVLSDGNGIRYRLSEAKAKWQEKWNQDLTSLNFDAWMESEHPKQERGTFLVDHDGKKIKYFEAFSTWNKIDDENSNGERKSHFPKWAEENFASGIVNGEQRTVSRTIQ